MLSSVRTQWKRPHAIVLALAWPAGTAWSCSVVSPERVPSSIACSRFTSMRTNSTAVIMVILLCGATRERLRNDDVLSRDDERRVGRNEVRLIRPYVRVLGAGRRGAHRVRVV